MRNILCTHRRHHVPSALIFDMAVLKRVCLDCRALMLAEVRTQAPTVPRWHHALPSSRFRMLPR